MKFNEKLKALREAKGYTQDEIASKLNISRQSVSKWEQGINEPDFDTVKELCKILDCSIAELIDDDREVVSTKEEKDERVAGWLFKITIALLMTASLFLIGLVFACNDEIITHWDIGGNVTIGSRFTLLFGLILLAFFGSLAVLMRI